MMTQSDDSQPLRQRDSGWCLDMPRNKVEVDFSLEYLQILNEKGVCDESLKPDMSRELSLRMYRGMLLTRAFDERMLKLQRQGRLGTFPPAKGQEAGQVAAAAVLEPSDWMVPSFREPGAMLWRGWRMEQILLYYNGFEEGAAPPEGVRDLPICVPVTSQLPHAVGLAWAAKLQGDELAVLCFLGDGATSEGDFHEALNFASLYEVPVFFVCQNNGWAISLPVARQTRSRTLAQKALAYEMPALRVDGNDPLAVYVACSEAAQRARTGGGPTFIESLTYRLSVHTTADDPTRYRADEEVRDWELKDPLVRFQKYLRDQGVLDDEMHAGMQEEIEKEIRAAVTQAESQADPNPFDMFDFVYADIPESLREQRAELRRRLERSDDLVKAIESKG